MAAPSSKRIALVTGASAGIGEALAREFAARGFDLVLTARREDRLRTVAKLLSQEHGARCHLIAADLADRGAPARIMAEVAGAGLEIDVLVNNAGYGLPGKFLDLPWEQHADFLQVLVVALAELAYRALPGMLERGYGRIINVASLAGLIPGTAGHTLYGASKSLVIKFSQSLHGEVSPRGVNVTALCPGFTYSEFHDVNGMRPIVSQMPSWMWMDAVTVARQAYEGVMAGRPVVVTGRVNQAIALLMRYVPEWLLNRVLHREARRFRRT